MTDIHGRPRLNMVSFRRTRAVGRSNIESVCIDKARCSRQRYRIFGVVVISSCFPADFPHCPVPMLVQSLRFSVQRFAANRESLRKHFPHHRFFVYFFTDLKGVATRPTRRNSESGHPGVTFSHLSWKNFQSIVENEAKAV